MHKSLDLGMRNIRDEDNENRQWRFAVGVVVRQIQTICPTLELIVGLSMKSLVNVEFSVEDVPLHYVPAPDAKQNISLTISSVVY